MHSLPLFVKIAGEPVILMGAGEAADAKARLIARAGGIAIGEDDPLAIDAHLAFIALEDRDAALVVAIRLRARGLLVNVVDQPDQCDFTMPAIVDRDPVLIAVSTGGASAGLAKAIRQRIEALLPERLGDLARALFGARSALRRRWPDARDRRRAIDAALAPGGALDPVAERGESAVEDWFAAAEDGTTDRTEIIQLRSADPDELTLRAARLLSEADRIVHPPETPPAILVRARADAARLALPADAPIPPAPGLTVRIVLPDDPVPAKAASQGA